MLLLENEPVIFKKKKTVNKSVDAGRGLLIKSLWKRQNNSRNWGRQRFYLFSWKRKDEFLLKTWASFKNNSTVKGTVLLRLKFKALHVFW